MEKKIIFNFPPFINLTIFNTNTNKKFTNLYLYNLKNYICFNFKKNNQFEKIIEYDKETNSLLINQLNLNKNLIKNNNLVNIFLKSLNIYYFFKIKFKGKGYRLRFYKKNKIVKFYFGKSHISVFFFKKIVLKKITKYKFILKNLNPSNLKKIAFKVNKVKPVNLYTLRGLRISRQKIFKRKGKKGSYI